MLIKNARLVTPFVEMAGAIALRGGEIAALYPQGAPLPEESEVFDAQGGYVLPGLIDLHTHGGMGFDYMDGTDEAFAGALSFQASHGVTAALPTSVTASQGATLRFLAAVSRFKGKAVKGCRVLGAHLEGPYLSHARRGAHPAHYLQTPAQGWAWLEAGLDCVRSVTLAPELPGAPLFIRALRARGIVVSGGHDDSIESDIYAAIDAGMTHTTHILCAMSDVCKREGVRHVGLVTMALTDDRLTTEMIADNAHITPELARLVYRCKGASRAIVVSDCLRPAGMPRDGREYVLGPIDEQAHSGGTLVVDTHVAMTPDRSCFAGSIQTLDRMIANLVRDAQVPLCDAVRMATDTPARIIGERNRGRLAPGACADLCVMDAALRVRAVVSDGQFVGAPLPHALSRPA